MTVRHSDVQREMEPIPVKNLSYCDLCGNPSPERQLTVTTPSSLGAILICFGCMAAISSDYLKRSN